MQTLENHTEVRDPLTGGEEIEGDAGVDGGLRRSARLRHPSNKRPACSDPDEDTVFEDDAEDPEDAFPGGDGFDDEPPAKPKVKQPRFPVPKSLN